MKTSKERIVEWIRKEYGLEDGVKFNLVDIEYGCQYESNPFYFKNGILYDCDGDKCDTRTILDYDNIEVIKEPLLTDEETTFLKSYISLIKKGVSTIEKWEMSNGIYIRLWHDGCLTDMTPLLKDSFQGLEDGLEYTLEELGLL